MDKQLLEQFEELYDIIISRAREIGAILDEYETDTMDCGWLGIERVWLSAAEAHCLCVEYDTCGNVYHREKRFPKYWLYSHDSVIREHCEDKKKRIEEKVEMEQRRLYEVLKKKYEC